MGDGGARRALCPSRRSSRSVTTCQHHGQVHKTSYGPDVGRRHDEHHRVIVNIATGFWLEAQPMVLYPAGRTFGVHS